MPRTPILTDEDGARLADWWADPINDGGAPPSFKSLAERAAIELGEDGKAITAKTAERYVRREFKRGHFHVRRVSMVPEPERDGAAEKRLEDKWRECGVHNFIVIKSREGDYGSDFIHSQLGYALTTYLTNYASFFDDGDRIGIGSGRAVHAVVNCFLRHRSKSLSNIFLMSLTGSIYPHFTNTDNSTIVDADSNVLKFIPYFTNPIDVKLMSSQIAYSNIIEEKKKRWISISDNLYDSFGNPIDDIDAETRMRIPTCSFVGIGVFHDGHRLYDYIKSVKEGKIDDDIYFKSIKRDLEEAYNINNDTLHSHGYVPLADLCNRFFVVNAPKGTKHIQKTDNITKDLTKLVNEKINPKLMTVPKTMLRHVPRNVLIAGTSKKAHAVRTMIERKYVKFKFICINSDIADLL